jgi:hypothetical protein
VNEVSHAFVLPAGLIESVIEFDPASIRLQIRDIEGRVNDLAFRLYGIGEDDRSEIESSFSIVEARREPGPGGADDEDDDGHVEDEDIQAGVPLPPNLSWLVGVSFGRFDVRLATGDRPVPPEPEPFDPLPAQSPGMWPADEERPAPPPDILVDDPGHDRDISSQVAAVAALVNVPEPDDLRRWLAHEFFPLHIKMYSKSRRKAPIYWQLATPSASYSVWLYIHAFSRDTMFRVQNNYVLPKLRLEESRLETMEHEAGANATAAQRRAVAEQESFVAELRSFLDEVKRVAPLWDPDPNDGVIINFAPLWRLVPHYRAWQKELKATWEALYEGKYDWSRLAMRFWPERAVPKCVADRSLAIAHGFQDILWLQGLDGRWKKRATPTRPVSELIAERSSDAVQAALASLLNAPAVVGGRKGRRRSNAGTTDTGGH